MKVISLPHRRNAGVTLVETLVAVFVLTVGITSALSLTSQSTSALRALRSHLIAAYLAQEGNEIVHNIRTTNWIQNLAWDAGLANGDYCADYRDTSLTPSCASYVLNTDTSQLYVRTSGTASLFSRRINILHQTDAQGVTYLRAQSIVSWSGGQVTGEDNLYDWR